MAHALADKLWGFARLRRGWNGYAADKPPGLPLYQAEDFLFSLRVGDITSSRVAPSVVGGVGITIREGTRKAYIEFSNDGRVYVMLSTGKGEPAIHPASTERAYAGLIGEIQRHLHC